MWKAFSVVATYNLTFHSDKKLWSVTSNLNITADGGGDDGGGDDGDDGGGDGDDGGGDGNDSKVLMVW